MLEPEIEAEHGQAVEAAASEQFTGQVEPLPYPGCEQ